MARLRVGGARPAARETNPEELTAEGARAPAASLGGGGPARGRREERLFSSDYKSPVKSLGSPWMLPSKKYPMSLYDLSLELMI